MSSSSKVGELEPPQPPGSAVPAPNLDANFLISLETNGTQQFIKKTTFPKIQNQEIWLY